MMVPESTPGTTLIQVLLHDQVSNVSWALIRESTNLNRLIPRDMMIHISCSASAVRVVFLLIRIHQVTLDIAHDDFDASI